MYFGREYGWAALFIAILAFTGALAVVGGVIYATVQFLT